MKTILAAEDDAGAREVLTEALSFLAPCAVTAVENGSCLIKLLDTVQPDLVVLDVNLPGLSGLEVYQILRARAATATLPVLFVSARSRAATAHLGGSFAWVQKPYHVTELLMTVARMLGLDQPRL